jgi:mitochondrial fission protein ELM1
MSAKDEEHGENLNATGDCLRASGAGLRLVVVLSDGIRGHINQSRGVAAWLAKRSGAEVIEMDVPLSRGIKRLKIRRAAGKLLDGGRKNAREWLQFAGGENLVRALGQVLLQRGIREGDESLLILSAGSMPAFYNLALASIWRCARACIMVPSLIGTDLFDFAIVPEHDFPGGAPNVLVTAGAPNMVVREELGPAGAALLRDFPPAREHRWGILVGGDDKNYRVSSAWTHRQIGKIFHEAEQSDVDLYLTTSRRTSPEAESAIRRMAATCPNVRFMLFASSDESNPVPAILGACDEVFVTDDSVNMVSEAATAGHRVVLVRAERAGALRVSLQKATAAMVSAGLLPGRVLWGAPRFDQTFKSFQRMGLLIDFKDWIHERRRGKLGEIAPLEDDPPFGEEGFNEARRAADWIIEKLPSVCHPEEETNS